MNRGSGGVTVYARSVVGYADNIVIRQANALEVNQFLVTRPSPVPGLGLTCLAPERESVRVFSRRVARAGRAAGVDIGPDAWACLGLRRALRGQGVVYTRFLDQAADLLIPLAGRRSPALVAVAAGSDITTVRSRPRSQIRATKATIRRAESLLCNSTFLEGKVLDLVPDGNTIVHHPGIPVPRSIPSRSEPSVFTVLAVSRLVPVKGVDRAIDSFAAAFAGRGDVRLRVLGDGPSMDELHRRTVRLGVDDQVSFLGRVGQASVYAEMEAADLLIQHNVRASDGAEEGLPAALLQAGAHGLPVVATRSGGVSETVVEGRSAVLVEPGDVDGMSDVLRELRDDPGRRREMGRVGFEFVRSEHNAQIQDRVLSELLRAAAR